MSNVYKYESSTVERIVVSL